MMLIVYDAYRIQNVCDFYGGVKIQCNPADLRKYQTCILQTSMERSYIKYLTNSDDTRGYTNVTRCFIHRWLVMRAFLPATCNPQPASWLSK